MSLETVEISDYSGGINFISDAAQGNDLGPGEMTLNSQEVEVFDRGRGLRPRRGIKGFLPSTGVMGIPSVTGDVMTNVRTWRAPGGPDQLMISNGKGLIARMDPNDSSNTWTVVLAAATTAEYEFIQAQDSAATEYVWALNGVSTPQKFNVSTVTLSGWGGTPPNGKFHRVWKNMMIVSGVAAQPQRIYYSAIANPESWPTNNFIDIKSTDDESEAIIALEVVGENLLVFKEKSVWLVFDSRTFENRRLADVGCVSRSATARSVGSGAGTTERVYWVAREGVFSTDGEDMREETVMIRNIFSNAYSGTWGHGFFASKQWTKLVMSDEGKLYLFNYFAWGNLLSSLLYMDTRLSRSDGLHPWYKFAGLGANVVSMTNVSSTAHVGAGPITTGLMGFLLDGVPSVGHQYAADIYRESQVQDNYTGSSVDVVGVVEFSEATILGGLENKSRLRRLNFFGKSGSILPQVTVDRVTTYTGPTLTIPSQGFVRCRPEMRGRRFKLKITFTNPSAFFRGELNKVEMKIRGGLEH